MYYTIFSQPFGSASPIQKVRGGGYLRGGFYLVKSSDVFSDFVIFEQKMTKSEKNMIFHDFVKSFLIIIKHHPRYLEMFLGFKEHVFEV